MRRASMLEHLSVHERARRRPSLQAHAPSRPPPDTAPRLSRRLVGPFQPESRDAGSHRSPLCCCCCCCSGCCCSSSTSSSRCCCRRSGAVGLGPSCPRLARAVQPRRRSTAPGARRSARKGRGCPPRSTCGCRRRWGLLHRCDRSGVFMAAQQQCALLPAEWRRKGAALSLQESPCQPHTPGPAPSLRGGAH